MLVFALLIASAFARTRESFDFNWRFVLGDQGFKPSPTPGPSPLSESEGFCSFDKNISGTQCYGLSAVAAASMDECAASCCLDYSCGLWQYQDPATNPSGGGGCWVGSDCTQNVSNPLWTSFVRTAPPPGPPPPSGAPCTDTSNPCAKNFDDSRWRVVNTPHDFIVEGRADPSCDRGHGYLCFNKSW
jgi:hypothetical protein